MKQLLTRLLLLSVFCFISRIANSQLQVIENNNAQALAQKLVGDGVTISNATLTNITGTIIPTGFFYNNGGTNIGIDSGIVLTNGRAKSDFTRGFYGVDGNGTTLASLRLANSNLSLPGDPDLAAQLGIPVAQLNDAIALEFDFVPLGDTIRFNYIMSSEEYTPSFVCLFNDAFAFFISGPGITGNQNIALVPGTNTPVSITNVNNIVTASCINNPQYYIDNTSNTFFHHDGHTTIFTAVSRVQPCQTYHLKLVIADQGDHLWDSGVFLQAKSLTSNIIRIDNLTQTDPQNNSYLVEGCATGAFTIKRPRRDPSPLSVNLSYSGTAQNGIDVQPLPMQVIIPANDSIVTVNVLPIVDNTPEGIETLKIYALAGCATGTPTDSAMIQIRDYDTLGILPRTANICKSGSIQLVASPGYSFYRWDPDPTLSNINIRTPLATPVASPTTYICTAREGTCNARDSAIIRWKDLDFISKLDVNCRNAATGEIHVAGGSEWPQPVEFSVNGSGWQPDSNFYNLPVGAYIVRIRDATGCIDSLVININQAFPDLIISNVAATPASCSGDPDGSIVITASGGNGPYLYSLDGINFQPGNLFNIAGGNYTVTIKDNNGCTATQNISIPLNNIVVVDAGADTSICEGTSYLIPAVSNGDGFAWSPASGLSNAGILNPVATPVSTSWYYLTATKGICSKTDSIRITVRPAPIANAGPDVDICFGQTIQLNGSGGLTYQWSPGTYFLTSTAIPAPRVKPISDITYSLIVKDGFNCQSLSADDVTITVTPAVRIFAGNDTVIAINEPLQLNAVELGTAGVISYNWSPGIYLDNAGIASPKALFTSPVSTSPYEYVYIVTGTTADGCEGSDDIRIKVYRGPEIYVPSGFTPDNDGRNDLLKAFPVGIKEFHFFRVFNRWGQMIFNTNDPSKGWDGRIKGLDQPTGAYVWIAEAIDYKGNRINRKGTFILIR